MTESTSSAPRSAVVTGAGSGIGRACAQALVGAGWRVAFVGRRRDALEASIAACADGRERAIAVPTDVGDPASVAALFELVKTQFGRLDLLFNNAGVSGMNSLLEDLPFETWQASLSTNLTGSFLCTQQAFRIMKAQTPMGGRIINNGSISAHAPRPNSVAYTSSKHAITGLTKSTSLDCRKYDIACSQIDIGNAATEMTERMTKGIVQAHGGMLVEPRMNVQHVADAVVFMSRLPLDANVQFMTIMATKMPFVGRG